MKNLVIGSMDANAGKTCTAIGIARALGKSFGYIKPLGDKLVYRKKRLWDYDAALMNSIFNLSRDPETMTVGFEHLKLRFKYDEEGASKKVNQMAREAGEGKDLLLVEGGKDIQFGISFYLNSLALARYLDASLVMVISGDENYIVDNVMFVNKYLSQSAVKLAGVIINKVKNIADFTEVYTPVFNKLDVQILGMVPYYDELAKFSVDYLAQYLLARVISGESHLNRRVSTFFVGAGTVDTVYADSRCNKENKLVITSGDRSDMLLASFQDACTAAVVVTDNLLPPPNVIARAEERDIPVLLVPFGVYETARQIEALTPMITAKDTDQIALIEKMVKDNINLDKLLSGTK
jgi:hypothetical protein